MLPVGPSRLARTISRCPLPGAEQTWHAFAANRIYEHTLESKSRGPLGGVTQARKEGVDASHERRAMLVGLTRRAGGDRIVGVMAATALLLLIALVIALGWRGRLPRARRAWSCEWIGA
ncbi:hypothetical protein AYJ54_39020 [Bradyrhizobium centrolobii]|uniref:Uncharacterized protein n=2 Tax=Bradyrhizobium centrolobii TaxID=1505087 RepID=A0A176Z8P9_9BRAD|nr:hypothetical protein AYJ54_39020 [Bradyrhizobium centrolobii]